MLTCTDRNNTSTERFFAQFTPIWFDVLGWIGLMAGLHVLNAKPANPLLTALLVLSLLFLFQYFMALFSRFQLRIPERAKRCHAFLRIAISVIFTTGLAWGPYYVAPSALSFSSAELSKT